MKQDNYHNVLGKLSQSVIRVMQIKRTPGNQGNHEIARYGPSMQAIETQPLFYVCFAVYTCSPAKLG